MSADAPDADGAAATGSDAAVAGDPPADGHVRTGWIARDGRPPGVRNHVLVLPSVICSHVVAERIAERVPGARAAPHDHGCGQIGADKAQTRRTFLGVARNPNVGAAVIVGLGCEGVQSDSVAAALVDELPTRELSIQGAGGTAEAVDAGVAAAQELVENAAEGADSPGGSEPPSPDLGALTLGIVSSDAAPSTVERADPAIGNLTERVLDAGGRVVVAGTERLRPHADAVAERAADADTAAAVRDLLSGAAGQPARTARLRRRAAGLAPADLAAAWGDRPIVDVLEYGAVAEYESGVALLDAPASVAEAATGLAAAGAQLVVHATADGDPTGHPVVPVVKVSGDAETVAALPEDVDVDAGPGATERGGGAHHADGADGDPGERLVERALAVATGEPCAAERHGLTAFAITRTGPSL